MKHNRSVITIIALIVVASMALGACAPSATPTTAPTTPPSTSAQPTTPSGAQPTTAPAQSTVAPVTAPTTAPAAGTPVKGGQLVWAELGGYYTLDPFVSPWHSTPQYAVFDTMLALKPDLTTYVGDLVEDNWEVTPDNLSVTFHVKPNVKFQDGTPVDAAALKWNLDHYADPTIAAPEGGWMNGVVKDVQAPDASTVKIDLVTPYAPLFFQLSALEMVSPTAYQKLGPDKFAQAPVGAGAWTVKEIVPDTSVLYTRNEDYNWAPTSIYKNPGPAYPDSFLIKYMSDQAVEYAALETGELTVLPNIPPQSLPQAQANKNITIVKGQENGGVYLGFNTQKAPFNNQQFRVALSYAINRDEIIQAGYSGEAVPMYSNLASSEMGYSQEMEDYGKSKSNDPEKAKQMLADLGYTAGSDGTMVGKDGKPLELTLEVPTAEEFKPVAETIQAQFADLGIKVTLDVKDVQTIKQMTLDGTYQMILFNYGLLDPSILTYLFDSKNIGASNRTRFNNPDLDKLLESADSALDWNTRKADVAKALQLLIDQRPNVPLYSRLVYAGYRNDQISGIITDPLGDILTMDAWMTKQ
ncbi:MAG: ABC transporter substrate-binding protein [Chloroflexi bacterium]|nr:ABC transporter substrate-binding protein [Chloroflexota bacterium]